VLDDIEEKLLLLADQPGLGPARPDIAPDLRYFMKGTWSLRPA
jgi:toxin ParE1/3/4